MPAKKFEHGRQKSSCKDCGGSGICKHGQRNTGTAVGAASASIIVREVSCKDCGGGGICEHGRLRSVCKDCLEYKAARLRLANDALIKSEKSSSDASSPHNIPLSRASRPRRDRSSVSDGDDEDKESPSKASVLE